MNIAIVAANFEPGEADKLRRAMATFPAGRYHTFVSHEKWSKAWLQMAMSGNLPNTVSNR